MSPITRLDPDEQDEDPELELELDYQSSLTTAQRFEMMLNESQELIVELLKRGDRKPVEIIKRA